LILLGHLSAAKRSSVTAAQLIEQTGLASSTVYRLVQEHEASGYLRKADDRRLYPKFSFEQGMSFGGIDVDHLTAACRDICAALGGGASEFITLRRETLFWHVAESHTLQSIRLRAGIGFVTPAVLLIALILIYPIIQLVVLSFGRSSIVGSAPYQFVGFKHYAQLMGDSRFWNALGVTFTFTALSIPLELARLTILFPWALPTALNTLIWRWMYNSDYGPVNATESLSLYAYRVIFDFLDFNFGAAVVVIQFLVIFAISLIYVFALRKKD
jgi:hypothetical protein